jgi:hypothetical protein
MHKTSSMSPQNSIPGLVYVLLLNANPSDVMLCQLLPRIGNDCPFMTCQEKQLR